MSPFRLLAIVVLVLDIFAIVSVVLGNSSVVRKVAWLLVILFLPVIGVVLYFVLGRTPQDA